MELKPETVLFINLVYRVILFVGFLSEDEAPNLPIKDPIFNWNYALTDRVVLILVNGLRDDFLDQKATPFLDEIANKNGTFARATAGRFLSMDSSLRLILTGVPGHSSLFWWNRPAKYKTILDYIACKCVIGKLPLENVPRCYYPGPDGFDRFKILIDAEEIKECVYVISFDFGGFFEDEYQTKLGDLDNQVREIADEVSAKWKDSQTTFVLTSGRGWSLWNRTDGRVDVPVVVWGGGILPGREKKVLRLVDVPVLVSSLIGHSFPAGCLGRIPTYFFNITPEARFHLMLYNNEHLEKTMTEIEEDDAFEVRSLKGFLEDEDAVTLGISIDAFMDYFHGLALKRMKYVSTMTILSFVFWNLIFMAVVVRGGFTLILPSHTLLLVIMAAAATLILTSNGIIQGVLLEILIPITLHAFGDIATAFLREGYRMCLVTAVASIAVTGLTFVPAPITAVLLMFPILLWPFTSGLVHRVNKKILAIFTVSSATLVCLPHFQVIGRSPSPGLVSLGVILNVTFFQFVYRSFKRTVDLQSWLITAAVLFSSSHAWSDTSMSRPISWSFLILALTATFFIRGTVLEYHLKFYLLLLVPFQLLSIRHECIFYFALSSCMFSWLFMENVPDKETLLMYRPSLFSVEKSEESATDKIQARHYRQTAFFLVFTFVSFFAAGNLPSLYSYDLNICKPFGGNFSLFLVLVKISIPFCCLVFSFLTLQFMKGRESSTPFIFSLFFADVFASCLLICTYFFDVFSINISHYLVLEFVVISMTCLHLTVKYLF